jgi:hypothetical protein
LTAVSSPVGLPRAPLLIDGIAKAEDITLRLWRQVKQ